MHQDTYEALRKARHYLCQAKKWKDLYEECSVPCAPTIVTLNTEEILSVDACSLQINLGLVDLSSNPISFTKVGNDIVINCGDSEPVDVYFNDNPFAQVDCGEDFFFYIVDQNDALVTPLSIDGNTIQIATNICASVPITINSLPFYTADCGESVPIIITSPDDVPLSIVEIDGFQIKVDVFCNPASYTINRDGILYVSGTIESGDSLTTNVSSWCNALPTKTGQTTSYNTGDNGDNQFGRDVSFFRNWRNSPFGNDWRFTSRQGAYHDGTNFRNLAGTIVTKAVAFPNNLMVDWSTANGDEFNGTVLMWHIISVNILTEFGLTQTWANYLAAQALANYGGYSGWRIPNENVFQTIKYKSPTVRHFGYEPFGISNAVTFWSNETNGANTAQALAVNNNFMEVNSNATKTGTGNRGLFFRLATYSKNPLTGVVTFT